MSLDRNIQRNVLIAMAKEYPKQICTDEFCLAAFGPTFNDSESYTNKHFAEQMNILASNLKYLEEHGLIKILWKGNFYPNQGGINAKGLDFLEEDGGLSAILNTVTVKFDANSIRQLVESGLLKTNVPKEKQGALKKAIQEAPGTVLQTAVSTIVGQGLSDPIGTAKAVAELFGVTWT